jgi:hypothetical protein
MQAALRVIGMVVAGVAGFFVLVLAAIVLLMLALTKPLLGWPLLLLFVVAILGLGVRKTGGIGLTSKRSRDRWVAMLTSDGVEKIAAHQMAWAAFPFDDSVRPHDRSFEQAVRSESWHYLRLAKGAGYEASHQLAREMLSRWAGMARAADVRYYATVYGYLSQGVLPDGS